MNITTYRFYLDHALSGRQSAVTQRFDVDGRRVVPLIATRQAARVSFEVAVDAPATIHADLEAIVPVHYEISWHTGTRRQVLAAGFAAGRTAVARPVPVSPGVLELSTDGPASWIDLRLVRDMHIGRHLWLLILLAMAFWLVSRGADVRDRDAMRLAWFKTAACAFAFVAAIFACEAALSARRSRTARSADAEARFGRGRR